MKKLFRHITKAIIFSFVICLFLPLQAYADSIPPRAYFVGFDIVPPFYNQDKWSTPAQAGLSWTRDGGESTRVYVVGCIDKDSTSDFKQCTIGVAFVNSSHYPSNSSIDYGNFAYIPSSDSFYNYESTSTPNYNFRLLNGDYASMFWFTPGVFASNFSAFGSLAGEVKPSGYRFPNDFETDLNNGVIPEYVDTNTDNYSLDKSLGMVKNAHWRHLESKNEYNKVLQDAINKGTGTGDPGAFDYKEIYTNYAKFVQDKCSFATTSTTGVKIGGRYQLQYASRVGFTFRYNLPDLLESTDYTKQYYKRFGSSKPYPIVNGTNFDANQNIQSLFTQAYAWNDSLPSIGTWRRMLVFKETKYWIDVRIIDTKNKTYGAWYAMDMETNKGSEVTTDNGDIDGDITSDDPADPYAKIEGEGDTFQDAEDNSHEVDHTQTYDQTWYDHIKDNTKKSGPAFKNLLSMISGIPKMIATLFSWLPNWVLELVSAFFALVIVLALLRFVLGS